MLSAKARTSSRIASASGGSSTAFSRVDAAAGEVDEVRGRPLRVEQRQQHRARRM